MEARPHELYWKAPHPRGGRHPGEHILNKRYLSHVLGLDESAHCQLLSLLVRRNIHSIQNLDRMSQEEWDQIEKAYTLCRIALRQERKIDKARERLFQENPHWLLRDRQDSVF